ncbi:bifunctional proline dehydrogenase/L-glutamate gamma-semialdehyde dehydrogenase PutA [Methylobacterium durans]|uniref:bifunctional proline dehydrogenase/L-glutamate gamma-semialdehyde dehydrogenase PutA n=1 Tax=Methylobacterium durans TaxID=2202825 RepID=UPI002AFFF284|nr:bifunctional proline dehydrogenase/L-glutamate gamma-semialdehyde dehydrogenase PutA [Methylobacterium durans]MEA1832731.1 bifunctional proline dehydrogenase/L-glutamate gamma-semialdehyde dehydrogenase PutA [Methylobacterium durans]
MPLPVSPALPAFAAPYAADDAALVRGFLSGPALDAAAEARVDALARDLVAAIRAEDGGLGGVEEMLREYSLSTREGLALMVLAEALLRVPDAATADRLIEDKLGQGDFAHHATRSGAILVNASAWALGLSARIIQPGETPEGVLALLARRIGLPALRTAARQAMRVMGGHFVLGETITAALRRAGTAEGRPYRYSFDMLGEGARTAADAEAYRAAYAGAIAAIGRSAGNAPLPERPGISVKLSALHPRYEPLSRARVMDELVPVLLDLARAARAHDLCFTIDAEEADRLELSLAVFAAVLADPSLAGWDGYGLAVQAYQKRCLPVIDHLADLARGLGRRLMVRLVKGAYWDTEVKRAQERGLSDYPVFTRKATTDLCYMEAAERLLAHRPRLFPQFATHNALTVASIAERAGSPEGYEFQRLHGMGEALYARLLAARPGTACRTYAPVGGHRDLLAYLVRRLLENGANSSFVSLAADPAVPVETLLRRPAEGVGAPERARHPRLPLPRNLHAPGRRGANGVEFGARAELAALLAEVRGAAGPARAAPIRDGSEVAGPARDVRSPIDGAVVGRVVEASPEAADAAMAAAARAAPAWAATPAADRAAALERAADLIEGRRGRLIHLLQAEAGKTLDDALSEIREAVDFCRYYALEGRRLFVAPQALAGPAGESNHLALRGRGVFVAISPWNFPLAIFVGQVAAALMAGNAVAAKPAGQTPLVAAEAVRLLHRAGIPPGALQLVPGDGAAGARLVAHAATAGIAFTGSTGTARGINRALAGRDGPIVPLIAETGGINVMLVDATALPEQVADDVVTSAFRSAGQRCSALRLLLVQADVADRVIAMVTGAARELRLGDPRDPATHVGPVIDAEAKRRLDAHAARMRVRARIHLDGRPPAGGHFVAPQIYEIGGPADLTEEVFGPILHVARYAAADLDRVLEAVAALRYGLTLGIHSRIDATVARVVERLPHGNVYVNRNMIGAVVGVQPFGGCGLSGTGPKAGGPHYLPRFAAEQTVTINTAASGGDAALLALDE